MRAVIGVFLGGQFGAKLTRRLKAQRLSLIFGVVLAYLGIRMIFQGLGIHLLGA